MQDKLEQVFGPPGTPLQIPPELHDQIAFDPMQGGDVVMTGIQHLLDWLVPFLLTAPGFTVFMLIVIIVILFALPTNDGRPG